MTLKNIYDTFVVRDDSYPVSLTTDDLFSSKEAAEEYALSHNNKYSGERFFKPVKTSTLDEYFYLLRQDSHSEGQSYERETSLREAENEDK